MIHGDLRLTCRELALRAGRVAHALRAAGIVPGDRVALCQRRSPDLVTSMLGVLEAGAAYVPLDAADPAERLAHILGETEPRALLVDSRDSLPEGLVQAGAVLLEAGEIAQRPADRAATTRWVGPDQLAYVIYTSGSSGRPKGVAMRHGPLVNLLCWHARTRPDTLRLRTAQVCSVSFDFSFHEIFSTLCLGGTLVVADEPARRDPFALARFLAAEGIERVFLPVTSLVQLAEAVAAEPVDLALKEVVTTGERLPVTPSMAELFRRTGARLHNHYGATEFQDATTHTLEGDPAGWPAAVPIGRPVDRVEVRLVHPGLEPVAADEPGELCIGGAGLARGYWRRPALTAESFVPDPFGGSDGTVAGGRLYRTGDLARRLSDGTLEHLGRADDQVKVGGVRIEPGEIEAGLREHPWVRAAAVAAHEVGGHRRLVAHVVLGDDAERNGFEKRLHAHLARRLSALTLPEAYVALDDLPLTSSGKLDRRRLVPPARLARLLDAPLERPRSELERLIAGVWEEVLQLEAVGVDDPFFAVGGTSLHLVEVQRKLAERLGSGSGAAFSTVDLFRYPTVAALAGHLQRAAGHGKKGAGVERELGRSKRARRRPGSATGGVAIVGMAGRFPGAGDLESFWQNLRAGVESIRPLSEAEIEQRDRALLDHPDYVKVGALLDEVERFDAAFFDISPKEAATLDPQHRLVLECAWEAFERAGYAPGSGAGPVGVYLGSSLSTYLVNNLNPHYGYAAGRPFIEADMRQFQVKQGNDGSYLPTRVSFKLGLEGPSAFVQTACSTSLVAVHLARRSLLAGECDLALAGGMSVIVPHRGGYLYEEGMIRSPDGRCRAFDARAAGTLFGNGGGVVLLRRLEDALADGAPIVAVVKGSAVNNDGSDKVGFTAPNVDRQAAVIEEALLDAGVDSGTVGYVEAHGTGTALGDPIEVSALNDAFRRTSGSTEEAIAPGRCALGSVKTNIGHLDEAAGIAGLIKAALAVERGEIPPSLHFERPNPAIDFASGPFFVNAALRSWPAGETPRRAGVSSFGMGGTNCHLVLEEAPRRQSPQPKAPGESGRGAVEGAVPEPAAAPRVLPLSARHPEALAELARRTAERLAEDPELRLDDLCFTAGAGRRHLEHRLAVVASSTAAARRELETWLERRSAQSSQEGSPAAVLASGAEGGRRTIAFLFSGQGSQVAGMGRELFESEPVFREVVDRCDAVLRPLLDRPLLSVLYPAPGTPSPIDETAYAQPALFAVEIALAELWRSWGIEPDVVLGHSVGQFAAACAAGVLSLEDGLALVAERGRRMQELPADGAMLSLAAGEESVVELLEAHPEVVIAAVNGSRSTVVSGPRDAVGEVRAAAQAAGLRCRDLAVARAFHSPALAPMEEGFARRAREIAYARPTIPIVSDLTGEPIGDGGAEPADWSAFWAGYWVDQLQRPVRFAAGVETLAALGVDAWVEISPRPTLLQLVRQELAAAAGVYVPSLRPGRERLQLARTLADLYRAGLEIDWAGVQADRPCRRVVLPTYPWQRRRHWIEPPAVPAADPANAAGILAEDRPRLPGHPLLGKSVDLAGSDELRFEALVGPADLPWLRHHRVFQTIIMPGVAYLETAGAAGERLSGTDGVELGDFLIHRAMSFADADSRRRVQVVLRPEPPPAGEGFYAYEIFSRPASDTAQAEEAPGNEAGWVLHASGRLRRASAAQEGNGEPATADADLEALRRRFTAEVPVETIYQGEREREIDLGPRFHATTRLWREGGSCLSRIRLPDEAAAEADAYRLHPVLLEACFLALTVTYPEKYGRRTYVPVGLGRLRFPTAGAGGPWREAWCLAELHPSEEDDPETLHGDLTLMAADGRTLMRIDGALLKRADRRAMIRAPDAGWTGWLYGTGWKPAPLPAGGESGRPGHWLVAGGDASLGPALADEVVAAGGTCTVALSSAGGLSPSDGPPQGPHGEPAGSGRPEVGTAGADAFGLDGVEAVVVCWDGEPEEADDPAGEALQRCVGLLRRVRELAGTERPPLLAVVTRGAETLAGRPVTDLASAALAGLARVIALEHPELGCVHVDLDPDRPPGDQVAELRREIAHALACRSAGEAMEDRVGLRGRQRYVARLDRRQAATDARASLRGDATYLVTGGLGGLGLEVAGLLAARGARHLALVGRSPAGEPHRPALVALAERGVRVVTLAADVADLGAVERALGELEAAPAMPPLAGVLHLAGVLDDGVLARQTAERFAGVMAPKAAGAWNLHRATAGLELDFFVLFSSVSSLLGTPGQGNYAAANAFLDGLASWRRSRGLPALTVQWGSWAEVGMSARLGLDERLERAGEGVLPKQEALSALDALLAAPRTGDSAGGTIAVLPFDWTRFFARQEAPSPFLSALRPRSASPPAETATLGERLASAPEGQRRGLLETHVREQLEEILGQDAELEPDAGFFSLGMDSLTSIELRNTLQTSLGCPLPQTLAFDYPTLASLVAYLYSEALGLASAEGRSATTSSPEAASPLETPPPAAADDVARRLAAKLGVEIDTDG